MIVSFETPTEPVPKDEKTLEQFAAALSAAPGQWALLGQYIGTPGGGRSYAWSISRGTPELPGRAFGPGFEVETRTMLGEQRVYVRFSPDSQPPQES
ncbi:hypothetical protein [Streptomyces sp. MP131-18]|uniref:hypothetical protein n=1 Tax=Streptomyces sp. MP131-18 TaxID=1857892 RepID=UPI00097C2D98|nr:hypothetical protein [Streptomyces sp. MP131-18]ONK13095.1 hypothetical protein STBA_38570 [Streptomyces sp. MP131-18]